MAKAALPLSELLRRQNVFGRLRVLGEDKPRMRGVRRIRFARCQCECGEIVSIWYSSLIDGRTQSCGCLHDEISIEKAIAARENWTRHGQAAGAMTAEYRAWLGMKYRCFTETSHKYKDYGARGITVCDRWRNSFEAFYEDMGAKPSPTHSIDRIDNDGNYEPGNCRWATPKEQMNNRRV